MDEVSRPPQRELQAGRDYPIWPNLKWAHASRLAAQLEFDFNVWRTSLGDETRSEISANGREVTFFATIHTPPPTYEWSLALGDIIHNYRSALDALAWAVANLDGNSPDPRAERRIYFPFAQTPEVFERLARGPLKSVPEFVLERLQSLQPYYGGPPEQAVGVLMNDLSTLDKHRSSLELRALAIDGFPYSMKYRYVDSFDDARLDEERYQWLADNDVLADGQPILAVQFAAPVSEAEICDLPLSLQLERAGVRHDVFQLLALMNRQVELTFRRVNLGFRENDAELLNPDVDSELQE